MFWFCDMCLIPKNRKSRTTRFLRFTRYTVLPWPKWAVSFREGDPSERPGRFYRFDDNLNLMEITEFIWRVRARDEVYPKPVRTFLEFQILPSWRNSPNSAVGSDKKIHGFGEENPQENPKSQFTKSARKSKSQFTKSMKIQNPKSMWLAKTEILVHQQNCEGLMLLRLNSSIE